MKKKLAVFIIVVLIIFIGAYFLLPESIKDNLKGEDTPKVKIVDENSNSRPVAVMINNNKAVWNYQSGLMDAYMVYELLVEGGITREMAVYKDADTDKIASVRSARHYFLDYAMENDAIYVHWGWSPQAESDIKKYNINSLNGLTYENKYFFRDRSLPVAYEHKGYTTMESIMKGAKDLSYRLTTDEKVPLNYSATPVDMGEDATSADKVDIQFSPDYTAHFVYDNSNKVYYKYQNDTEMIDYTSKDKISAKNIITYKVTYDRIAGDNHNRLDMEDVGSGEGYFISEGKAIPITWSKSSRSSKTKYYLKSGEELVVNDGNTFVEINPTNRNTNITGESVES